MSHLPSLLLVFLGKDTFSDDKRMKGKETRISWSKGGFCQEYRKSQRNRHWSLYEIQDGQNEMKDIRCKMLQEAH